MKIICVCCTYGRPHLLPEMLWCFLNQTHLNRHLIILNDQEDLQYKFHHPLVTVLNHSKRFGSLGEKREYGKHGALRMGAEAVAFWDDDDLWFPDHLDHCSRHLKRDISKPRQSIYTEENKNPSLSENLFFPSMLISADWCRTHRFLQVSGPEDRAFVGGARVDHFNHPTYIYRWGLNIWHISGVADREQENWERAGRVKQGRGRVKLVERDVSHLLIREPTR